MNRYHIEVIGSKRSWHEVDAEWMVIGSGCITFQSKDIHNDIVDVAVFPINRICIYKIEYDIDN